MEKGSDVNIRCQFSYPEKHHTQDVKVYWKTDGTSVCSKTDNDKKAFVFHPNQACVLPEFRGRTKLIGNETSGDCSLQILNITMGGVIYVRIIAKGDQYSFKKQKVSISLRGENPSKTWCVLKICLFCWVQKMELKVPFCFRDIHYTTHTRIRYGFSVFHAPKFPLHIIQHTKKCLFFNS